RWRQRQYPASAPARAGIGAAAPGGTAMRTLQPEDTFALRSASDAQPSPDGRQIAYVVNELDRAGDRSRVHLDRLGRWRESPTRGGPCRGGRRMAPGWSA